MGTRYKIIILSPFVKLSVIASTSILYFNFEIMKKLLALTLVSTALFTTSAFANETNDEIMTINTFSTFEVSTQDAIFNNNNYIVTIDTKARLETFKKDLEKVAGATFGDIIFSQWEWYMVTVQLNSPEDMKKIESIDGVLWIQRDEIMTLDMAMSPAEIVYNVDDAFRSQVEKVFVKLEKLSAKKQKSVFTALSKKIEVTLTTKKVSAEKEEKLKYLQNAVDKASK